MTAKKNLFSADPNSGGLTMPAPTVSGSNLTPQQRSFNRLIAKIEKMTENLTACHQLADAHRVRHGARIEPLRQTQLALNREMVLFLHGRLQRKGCTPRQQSTMKEILCALAQVLIAEGDKEMLSLHDHYSEDSFADQQKAALAEAGAMMEDVLGMSLDDKDSFESIDDLFQEGLRQAQAESEAREHSRQARGKPGKRRREAEQQQEAQTTVREVYRKLASALHPDREPDAAERKRKTALMSEVNTAYGRRDLLTLLRLQLHVEQIDPHAIGQLSANKLKAMTAVLKEQARSLEMDLFRTEQGIRMEFALPPGSAISVSNLSTHLNLLERSYAGDIKVMRHDLRRIEDDRAFKQWLKEQREAMSAPDLMDMMDFLDTQTFDAPARRRR